MPKISQSKWPKMRIVFGSAYAVLDRYGIAGSKVVRILRAANGGTEAKPDFKARISLAPMVAGDTCLPQVGSDRVLFRVDPKIDDTEAREALDAYCDKITTLLDDFMAANDQAYEDFRARLACPLPMGEDE